MTIYGLLSARLAPLLEAFTDIHTPAEPPVERILWGQPASVAKRKGLPSLTVGQP